MNEDAVAVVDVDGSILDENGDDVITLVSTLISAAWVMHDDSTIDMTMRSKPTRNRGIVIMIMIMIMIQVSCVV